MKTTTLTINDPVRLPDSVVDFSLLALLVLSVVVVRRMRKW